MKSSTETAKKAGEFPADVRPENISLMSNLETMIGIPEEILETTVRKL